MADLSVIIVNYNTADLLRNCLSSIYENVSDLDFEVIVVDNDSKDSSTEMIKKSFPQAILIESKKNLGFVKANNLGVQKAKGKYILLLNSDTIVTKEGFSDITNFMDSTPDAGVVGGKIYFSDTVIQDSCRLFPTMISEFLNQTICLIKYFNPFSKKLRMLDFKHDRIIQADWVTGAYMFIRKEIIDKTGLFDPAIFMYFEDTDFCLRVKQAGYNVYFVPLGKIYHLHGASSKKIMAKTSVYCFLSSIIFFKKVYSPLKVALYKNAVITAWFILKYLLDAISLILKNDKVAEKRNLFCNMLSELGSLPETFENF